MIVLLLGGLRQNSLIVLADKFFELAKIIVCVQPLRGMIGDRRRAALVLIRSGVQRVLESRFEL